MITLPLATQPSEIAEGNPLLRCLWRGFTILVDEQTYLGPASEIYA